MGTKEEVFKQFDHGDGQWQQFINTIKITNIHGWRGQQVRFLYPVVALVGENGIGKSTFLKAAVCAYNNKQGKDFYPSKMFMSTQWDERSLEGATIEYRVRIGNKEETLKWRKTKDWGFSPKSKKPERDVFFLDISRTLPLAATAGYARIAMTANAEVGEGTALEEKAIQELSYVLGYQYLGARFTGTNVDSSRKVGLLTRQCGEISQFHQGAGEAAMLDMFKLLQDIPKYSLLVIDEVENSLHPQAQRRFIKYLLKVAKNKKIQIILSTHSPFVLEELPPIARIMLVKLSDSKEIITEMSSEYALSTLDDNDHPEMYVYVEDEEAVTLFWEILKRNPDKYPIYLKKLFVQPVGSYSIVKMLNKLSIEGKMPCPGFGIVDGDKSKECSNCLSFPGEMAPEKMVFQEMQEKGWNRLDERMGIGAGSLFSYLDDTILQPDHHKWTTYLGDRIKKSKDVVWTIMVEEWCKQCLDLGAADDFINKIDAKLNAD